MFRKKLLPSLSSGRTLVVALVTGSLLVLFLFLLLYPSTKEVTIACEEDVQTFSTRTNTVEGAIKEAHISLHEKDIVDPPLDAPIKNDTVIKILKAKPVFIITDGEAIKTVTHKENIREVLHELNISLTSDDEITPSPDKNLKTDDYNYICIKKARTVKLKVGDKKSADVKTTRKLVWEVLSDNGIALNAEDRVTPCPDYPVVDGMKIVVTKVEHDVFTETISTPYDVIIEEDDTMYEGEEVVLQEGRKGSVQNTVKCYYKNGRLTSEDVIASVVLADPVDEIVLVGTKTENQASYTLYMEATAYTPGYDCGSITATGLVAGYGIAAVDPSIIPLGSRLYIEGYGYAIAADTGGAIWGNRIDLCFDTYNDAMSYGRRNTTVYILD